MIFLYLFQDLCCTIMIAHRRLQPPLPFFLLAATLLDVHLSKKKMLNLYAWQRDAEAMTHRQRESDRDRVCIAVSIARELSYASKAAPAIWPPRLLHPLPSFLFLPVFFSLLQFLSFTQHAQGTRLCVRPAVSLSVCVCVCVCVWELLWQPPVVE